MNVMNRTVIPPHPTSRMHGKLQGDKCECKHTPPVPRVTNQ